MNYLYKILRANNSSELFSWVHGRKIFNSILSSFYLNLVKDSDSFCFLAQANDKSEWLWQIHFKFFVGIFFTIMTLSIASVLIFWLWNGYFDVTLVYHPWRFMLVKVNTNFENSNNKKFGLYFFQVCRGINQHLWDILAS